MFHIFSTFLNETYGRVIFNYHKNPGRASTFENVSFDRTRARHFGRRSGETNSIS